MISKEAASINESDGKTIRIIEGAAFVNLPEKRFGGVVESDGLYNGKRENLYGLCIWHGSL